jgi:hypothetical protein
VPVDDAVGYLDGEDGRPAPAVVDLAFTPVLACRRLGTPPRRPERRVAWRSSEPLLPCNTGSGAGSPVHDGYLVDSASSHMLVLKIKPCMSKYKHLYSETANGSLNQL